MRVGPVPAGFPRPTSTAPARLPPRRRRWWGQRLQGRPGLCDGHSRSAHRHSQRAGWGGVGWGGEGRGGDSSRNQGGADAGWLPTGPVSGRLYFPFSSAQPRPPSPSACYAAWRSLLRGKAGEPVSASKDLIGRPNYSTTPSVTRHRLSQSGCIQDANRWAVGPIVFTTRERATV
jgi:hypothetical protein